MLNRSCPRSSTDGFSLIGIVVTSFAPMRPVVTGSSGAGVPLATVPYGSGRDDDPPSRSGAASYGFNRDSFHMLIAWNFPSRVHPARPAKSREQRAVRAMTNDQ